MGGVVSTYVPIGLGAYSVGKAGVKLAGRVVSKRLMPSLADSMIQSPVVLKKTPRIINQRKPYQLSGKELLTKLTPKKVGIAKGKKVEPLKPEISPVQPVTPKPVVATPTPQMNPMDLFK